MARKPNAVDREFDKIAAVALPAQPASDVAVRPKTLPELAAEYDRAAADCRTFADTVDLLDRELTSARKSFAEACERRTAVWHAIEQIHGAEG